MKIVIIGAGLGGLTFGALACKDGHEVVIYDKNDTPGGVVALLEHDGYKLNKDHYWLVICLKENLLMIF